MFFTHFVGDACSARVAPVRQMARSADRTGTTARECREALMVTTQICLAAATERL
jgi:hypothetical protein